MSQYISFPPGNRQPYVGDDSQLSKSHHRTYIYSKEQRFLGRKAWCKRRLTKHALEFEPIDAEEVPKIFRMQVMVMT